MRHNSRLPRQSHREHRSFPDRIRGSRRVPDLSCVRRPSHAFFALRFNRQAFHVRARIHKVKIAPVVSVKGMFEKGYPFSVRGNPWMSDIAIRFEQNLANGIFELLRSTRAAYNGKLLAV